MEKEREDQEFEREENVRLKEAFARFNALYNKAAQNSHDVADGKAGLSDDFQEDEYEYIVDKYIDLFNSDMARVAADMGFRAYPYSPALLVKYCDSLVIAKEFDAVLDTLNNYKDSFPPNSEIYLSYCRAYIGKKNISEARRYYNMAIEVESFPEDVCDSIHTLAQDCMEAEFYQEAIFYLERTADLTLLWNSKNQQKEKEDNVASFFFDYAFCLEKLEQDSKALEYYQKSLDIDPFNDIAWHNVGIIYARKEQYQKAYEAFDYALALNPKNIHALFNMGQLCIECKLPQEAIKHFSDFCKLEKNNPDGISGLALAHFLIGDLSQSEILYHKALIFDPEHIVAKAGLADLQAEKKLREKMKKRQKNSNNGKEKK